MNSQVLGLRRGLGRSEKCHRFCLKNTAFFKNITSLFSTSLLQKWSISKIALKSSKMSLGQVQWTGWSLLKYHDVIFDWILSPGQASPALQLKFCFQRFLGAFRIEILKKSGTFLLILNYSAKAQQLQRWFTMEEFWTFTMGHQNQMPIWWL